MGIFNTKKKEDLTYLEEYKLELKKRRAKEINSIVVRRIEEVLEVIEEQNKFGFAEEDMVSIFGFYIDTELVYDDIDDFYDEAKSIYTVVFPYGKNTYEYEKLVKMFIGFFEHGGIMDHDLFDSKFYALFRDERNYLLLMKEILAEESTISNMDVISSYACGNRQYFVSEDLFFYHMQNIVHSVKEWALTDDPAEIALKLERYQLENQHMVGIYDISEASLEELDDLINSADGILEQLRSQCKISDEKTNSLRTELEGIKTRIENIIQKEEKRLQDRKEELVQIFKKELATAAVEQENSFKERTDHLLNGMDEKIQSRLNDLKIALTTAEQVATGEVERIRKAGDYTTEKIEKIIHENPELTQILTQYMPIPEMVSKLSEVEKMIQVAPTASASAPTIVKTSTVVKTPTIVVAKEIPEGINHFFDPRISFTSRVQEIKEKMQKNEERGEIYHEKFLTLVKMIIEDCNPYLWGNSGLGKTYMIEQAFKLLDLEYRPINKILEDYDIIGSMLPNGDYSSPLWYECYKYGYGAFLDELDSSNSEATIVINSFTSNKQGSFYPFPNQEIVYRHPNFRIVAAGNTAGTGADSYFNDRKQLDESVQQRLMPLYLTPDSRIEQRILKDYPDWFEFVQNFRKATNQYAKSRDDMSAPGEVTTRDTEKIKQMKDDKAFTDEEILEYEFIENKNDDYLGTLLDYLNEIYYRDNKKSKKIYQKFKKQVNVIRGVDS